LKDTLSGSLICAVLIPIYALLCGGMVGPFGCVGLAAAHAVYWSAGVLIAALVLRWRLGRQGGRRILGTLGACTAAALTAHVALRLALNGVSSPTLRIAMVAGAFLFYLLLGWLVFGLEEISFVFRRVRLLWPTRRVAEEVVVPAMERKVA